MLPAILFPESKVKLLTQRNKTEVTVTNAVLFLSLDGVQFIRQDFVC